GVGGGGAPAGAPRRVFSFLVPSGRTAPSAKSRPPGEAAAISGPPRGMTDRQTPKNRHIASAMRAAMELRDEKRDHPTSNLLQELLDETEKRIWFLYEVSQGSENTD